MRNLPLGSVCTIGEEAVADYETTVTVNGGTPIATRETAVTTVAGLTSVAYTNRNTRTPPTPPPTVTPAPTATPAPTGSPTPTVRPVPTATPAASCPPGHTPAPDSGGSSATGSTATPPPGTPAPTPSGSTPLPPTGDAARPVLWGVLGILAAAGLWVLRRRLRR